ncbi:MAG: hypothetical protein IJU53_08985, partial [Thermoguttaceae bacterium]|nr:hypothetical protein [Thermoguttaceae bacterium]
MAISPCQIGFIPHAGTPGAGELFIGNDSVPATIQLIMKTECGTKWARLRVSHHIENGLPVESGGSLNETK